MCSSSLRGFVSALATLGVVALAVAPADAAPRRHRHISRHTKSRRSVAGSLVKTAATHIVDMAILREEDGTRIVLWGKNPFTPDVEHKERPYSTSIYVRGTWGGVAADTQRVGRNGIETVSYGQIGRRVPFVLVRANADMRLPHSVASSQDRRRWEIKIWSPNAKSDVVAQGITIRGSSPATNHSMKPAVLVAAKPAAQNLVVTSNGTPADIKQVASAEMAKPAPVGTVSKPVAVPSSVKSAPASSVVVANPSTNVVKPSRGSGVYPMLVQSLKANAARQNAQVASANGFAVDTSAQAMETVNDKRVSLDFIAADINDVLKAMSLQSGINIVTGSDVKGTITVSLNKVPLSEALDMVTRLSGFKYDRFGSAFVVGTPISVAAITAVTGKDEVPVTEFIPYRYTSPANISRALMERFPGISVPQPDKVDPIANPAQPKLLVLTDKKARVLEARDFVEKLEQAVSVPTLGATTEVYRIKYASASDLVVILSRLVPTINVQLGPSQGFQSGSTGASASYSSSAPTGGGGANLNAGQQSTIGASGGGTSNPTGAVTSGVAPVTLLLTGSPADIARAKEVLEQLDLRTAQLQFEAKVVDVNRDDLSKIGIRYDFNNGSANGVRIGEKDTNGAPMTGSILGQTPPGARAPAFGAIFRTPYSIGLQLDAVVNQGRGRILANPTLSAIEGQPAVVFIGDQIKYVINIQVTQTGQTIQTETATVGVTLKVTGKSSPDGTITLYIHPEVSTITSYLTLANGIALPQISTRFVDTTIRVKDGETIGIGGLITNDDITNVQKVPFLGDIPFFGQLFKRTDKTKRQRELVIMITSRIAKE